MRFLWKWLLLGIAATLSFNPALASERSSRDGAGASGGGHRIDVRPYIEAAQVLTAELSPGNDTVTYTRLAVGVDTSINGRNTAGEVSLRYARNIGWSKDARDGDEITGIARVSASIIPRTLTIEAGGLAARTQFEGNGGSVFNPFSGGSSNDLYSVYAGPSLQTHAGDVALQANYRIGYTRLDGPDGVLAGSNGDPVDVFDDSTVQVATLHAGTKPGDVLPVGLGLGAGWYREDISNLDQRAEDKHVRADVTVPVSRTVALVGGIGYEDVKISNRDALFDSNGNPVLDSRGRYVTDKSAPRVLAYDVDGLIWDVGVIWRPSVRTTLEAYVGRRYGATSYHGTFSWQMDRRSSVNVMVYDNIAGFGGQLNNALSSLPTSFVPVRNALSGDLNGCVGSLEGGSCLGAALGSIRSATFRGRGVAASYAVDLGRIQAGIGAGYDRRKFIAAEGTILASANGVIDENIWLAAYMGYRLDQRSSLSADIRANWLNSGFDPDGNITAWGAGLAYDRLLTDRLTATAAVRLDGITREKAGDASYLSALLGMRYSF
jgi:hypothetical protein